MPGVGVFCSFTQRLAGACSRGDRMNVFELRNRLIEDYRAYVTSFVSIRDPRIQERVEEDLAEGLLWPEPRVGLNPAFGWYLVPNKG